MEHQSHNFRYPNLPKKMNANLTQNSINKDALNLQTTVGLDLSKNILPDVTLESDQKNKDIKLFDINQFDNFYPKGKFSSEYRPN
jgi:hypothetical protein